MGGDPELLGGMWGAAVGAHRAVHPWPELCVCFHHTVECDPHKELLRALQSKVKPCKVPLPRVGLSTGAIKTIFSRKLLMNFGFPPSNPPPHPRELRLTSVETDLGITLYSLRKKITWVPFSACVCKFQPFLPLLLLTRAAPALFASPARQRQGVAAALRVLKKAHTAGTKPSRAASDELIISLTCLARLSANIHKKKKKRAVYSIPCKLHLKKKRAHFQTGLKRG